MQHNIENRDTLKYKWFIIKIINQNLCINNHGKKNEIFNINVNKKVYK